jgi:hypothetical protein
LFPARKATRLPEKGAVFREKVRKREKVSEKVSGLFLGKGKRCQVYF